MKVGIVIERSNYYRLLGPVVDAALARGWEVVCLHDYSQSRGGFKGHLFPAVEAMPKFRRGDPGVVTYDGSAALLATIQTLGLDAAVSIMPPPEGWTDQPRPAWISLQYQAEIFRYTDPYRKLEANAVGVYSDWWIDWGLGYWKRHDVSVDVETAEIRRRAVVVGFPELDRLESIDRESARSRWGLMDKKPVVLFLPFPINSFHKETPWYRWVYAPSRHGWVYSPWLRPWRRLRLILAGFPRLIPRVNHGWDDRAVVRAVRRFCDANGALLVVKTRKKDRVTSYVDRAADLVLDDENDDPPTILHALALADLCVHFYSTAVMEAVASRVPSLSICPRRTDMDIKDDLFSRRRDSLYRFEGVAWTMSIRKAIETLPWMRLADFRLDGVRREEYVSKFLGFCDGKNADRLLDVVREHVEEARR